MILTSLSDLKAFTVKIEVKTPNILFCYDCPLKDNNIERIQEWCNHYSEELEEDSYWLNDKILHGTLRSTQCLLENQ